jgi:tetratricopeptide (TPR) repeat protein
MGNALQDLGMINKAIEAYNKALALKPNYAEALNNKGNACHELGKLEDAIEAYNKALSLKPNYAEAFNNMGTALKDQDRLKEALEAYNKALALRPDYPEALYNFSTALQDQGKLDEAIEALNKATELKPDYAGAYLSMAFLYLIKGNAEKGLELYNWRWQANHHMDDPLISSKPFWNGQKNIAKQDYTCLARAGHCIYDKLVFLCTSLKISCKKLHTRVPTETGPTFQAIISKYPDQGKYLSQRNRKR